MLGPATLRLTIRGDFLSCVGGLKQPLARGAVSGLHKGWTRGEKVLKQAEEEAVAEMAYCVKCRTKTEMTGVQQVTMKNGRPALKGKCSKCGTAMFKILPAKK